MTYLTFHEYQALGGTLKEAEFIRAEFAARMKIDYMTRGLLREAPPGWAGWEAAKMLVMELIERGYLGDLDGNDYASEGNDGRSVSYESRAGKAEALIRESLWSEELGGAPLIDRGGLQTARALRG